MKTPAEIRKQKLEQFFSQTVDEEEFAGYTRNFMRETTMLALDAADKGDIINYGDLRDGFFFLNELCDILDPCKNETATGENKRYHTE